MAIVYTVNYMCKISPMRIRPMALTAGVLVMLASALIVAVQHLSKSQVEFHVPEEEPDRPWVGPPTGPMSIPLPSKYPTPYAFPMWGCCRNKKSPLVCGGFFHMT